MKLWLGLCIAWMCIAEGSFMVLEDSTCRRVTSFDISCLLNSTVLILSARPCSSQDVFLTIYKSGKGIVKNSPVTFGKTLFNVTERASEIKLSWQHSMDPKKYIQNFAVIKISLGEENRTEYNFTIPIVHRNCYNTKPQDTDKEKNPHIVDTECDSVHTLGDFSEACIVNETSKKNYPHIIPNGLYMQFVDFCTVPFSNTIGKFVSGNFSLDRYTESMIDDEAKKLKMKIETKESDHTIYIVKLMYTDVLHEEHLLLNQQYNSGVGAMCPLNDCSLMNSNLDLTCTTSWIDYYYGELERLVDSHIKYLPCTGSNISIFFEVKVENDEKLIFTEDKTLTTESQNNASPDNNPIPIHLGYFRYERNQGQEREDGYMLLDDGKMTLYASRNETNGFVDITVLRHFMKRTFPLFRTRIWTNEHCPENNHNKYALTIIAIGVIVFLILVLGICLYRNGLCFRCNRRKKEDGLPYQIQLEDTEMEGEY